MLKTGDYNHQLVKHLAETMFIGMVSNLIGMLFSSYLLYHTVPDLYITAWLIIAVIINVFRFLTTKHFFSVRDNSYDRQFINVSMLLLFLSALLYGVIVYCGITYNAPFSDIFIISMVIIALTSGATNTLVAVFPVFFVFTGTILFSLICNFFFLDIE